MLMSSKPREQPDVSPCTSFFFFVVGTTGDSGMHSHTLQMANTVITNHPSQISLARDMTLAGEAKSRNRVVVSFVIIIQAASSSWMECTPPRCCGCIPSFSVSHVAILNWRLRGHHKVCGYASGRQGARYLLFVT